MRRCQIRSPALAEPSFKNGVAHTTAARWHRLEIEIEIEIESSSRACTRFSPLHLLGRNHGDGREARAQTRERDRRR